MKLSIISINKEEDLYRVINQDNHSYYKGSKKECENYIEDNVFFIMCRRNGTEMGIVRSFKFKDNAEKHLENIKAKPSTYRNQEYYILERD